MIKHKQLLRHNPEAGIYGDCHRTAIACLLNLHPAEVPHFMENNQDNWLQLEQEWLKSRNLWTVSTVYQAKLETVLEAIEAMNPGVYGLLGGQSKNGCGHSVVICGGKIVWDPALDDSGIIGPMEDGLYWVTYLVPFSMIKEQ